MKFRNLCQGKPLWLAVIVSLLLHAVVLFVGFSSPGSTSGTAATPDNSTSAMRPRFDAMLGRRVLPSSPSSPARQAAVPVRRPGKAAQRQKLTSPAGERAVRSWSSAERADMDKFLNELAAQARPPSGRELSQRALAMARQLGRGGYDDVEGETSAQPAPKGGGVDAFSLQMYFDAFIRKLNRSAAFVRNDPRARGTSKALVEISLNPDGSLRSYRVLRSGDQEAEIAYIRSVVDRASPFSAFPPDIRKDRDSLTILMCIYPPRAGGSGGFSRSFGAQDCQD